MSVEWTVTEFDPRAPAFVALAVVEAEIAFATLLRRFPGLALDEPGPRWSPNTAIRGLQSLPVRF